MLTTWLLLSVMNFATWLRYFVRLLLCKTTPFSFHFQTIILHSPHVRDAKFYSFFCILYIFLGFFYLKYFSIVHYFFQSFMFSTVLYLNFFNNKALFHLVSISCWYISPVFSVLFWVLSFLQLILYIYFSSLSINHCSEKFWFLLLEKCVKKNENQDLATELAAKGLSCI